MTDKDLQANLPPFLDVLRQRAILADGGMATMIYQKGIYINQSFENLNLERPHLVKNVHQEFLRAGSELIRANTFSANRAKLAKYGLGDKVMEINAAGVRLAREAAGGTAWVAGVVGPLGQGATEDPAVVYTEQITHLIEAGVDALFFEGFSDAASARTALEQAQRLSSATPRVALLRWETGLKAEDGFAALPCDVLGVMDGHAPGLLVEALEGWQGIKGRSLAMFPGAGLPIRHDDRDLYMATPEYFMEWLRKGMMKGARLLGGSSGCHPEHIKAIKGSIKMLQPGAAIATVSPVVEIVTPSHAVVMKEFDTPSRLQAKLRAGEFVVSVEIDPPVGTDARSALDAARQCAESGIVDAINIADGPRATARMGPIDMAMLLRAQVRGVEPIVHFCCRDRNILGMQADLIGANALGIHNILMITGDPPKLGVCPFATAVYDVDAIGALRIGANLNSGNDLAGNPLKGAPTRLFLGAGANPGAIDLDLEIRRLEQKIEAGANYILTQPVYDSELYHRFRERVAHLRVPILLGILPLASFRNAEFLTKEVPGMHVPAPIRERLRQCEDKESARLCGIDIAREALSEALPTIQGTYIMPPFNRVDSALAVLDVARHRLSPTRP